MLNNSLSKTGISTREYDVIKEVIKGLTNNNVAENLYICEKTVKFHLTNIYRKLKIKSRSQLILWSIPYAELH